MAIEMKFDKDYLPPLGLPSFTMASTRLFLGPESSSLKEGRVTSIQTISGGGALRLGAETLSKLGRCKTIYVSNPHWGINYILKHLKMVINFFFFRIARCLYKYATIGRVRIVSTSSLLVQ